MADDSKHGLSSGGFGGTNTTLLIGNLPKNVTPGEFEEFVSQYGPIKRCYLVKGEDETCKGIGYATFALKEDAEELLKAPLKFNGHTLRVKYATSSKSKKKVLSKEEKKQAKKEVEQKKRLKKARLILRNLSFQANKRVLKKVFSKYGEVVEVTIPRKKDGKMRGFAFVGFSNVNCAAKAIKELNAKKIKGRPVAIDFVVPREEYLQTASHENKGQKVKDKAKPQAHPESEDDDEEDEDDDDEDDREMMKKKKEVKPKKRTVEVKDDESSEDESIEMQPAKRRKKNEEGRSDDSGISEDDSDDGFKSDMSDDEEKPKKNRKRNSDKAKDTDVSEGRTIFIRNLSFDTTEEDLKEAMEKFGPVTYALLCIDPMTEHPKGTAFVKFEKKEDADKCLEECAGEEKEGIELDGRRLNISLAVTKDTIQQKYEEKRKRGKDNRNLYLAREGLVYAGSEAAEGVSETDLKKRLALEMRRRKMLKNLHYFISATRLCIHNLPPSFDDKKLRKLFLDAVKDKTAKITEARVMRERKAVGQNGLGKSKGFGFVEFTEHEHALKALRQLNNNPDIFTPQKRPIVEFSIENRSALNAKKRRLEKSRLKLQELKQDDKNKGSVKNKDKKGQDSTKFSGAATEEVVPSFMGSTKKEGVKGLPSHFGPKIRHKSRDQQSQEVSNKKGKKREKQKQKQKPKHEKQLSRKTAEPQQNQKTKKKKKPIAKKMKKELKDEVKLNQLVKRYRKKITGANDSDHGIMHKKQKWFS